MFDAIKPLVDSGIINEDTHQAISEAWETKLHEARETIRAELREEFAQRYEHDKGVMVDALDNMVTEALSEEIKEFAEEKRALAEDRVKFQTRMVENANKFDQFMVSKLAEELKELRSLEKFVVSALAEEIQEFETDKRAVVEARVRMVSEAKTQLTKLKGQFVERSAKLVKEAIANNLQTEMVQLKEDIQVARENMFGRRLFEAFASEFAVTHLNENREIAKLRAEMDTQSQKLAEATRAAEEKTALVESKEKEIKIIKESTNRKDILANLLKPLNKEKASIMSELLESVQAEKLQSAFEKYLPAVLNNTPVKTAVKVALTESRSAVTGDKTAKVSASEDITNVIEIKRLAGLK
jgi:hypothetical protein